MNVLKNYDSLIGQTEDNIDMALRNSGTLYQIVQRDAEVFAISGEYRPDRLNLTFKDGRLESYTMG